MHTATHATADATTDACWRGELTIAHARELKDRVIGLIATRQTTLDLTGITHVDGAGLQVLLLLRREADRLGIPFERVIPSRAVRMALDMAQVDDTLRPVPQSHLCSAEEATP